MRTYDDDVAPPSSELFSKTNNNSVAILLIYGTTHILLTSDSEAREENSAGAPLVSVRAPTFAVSRTRPRVEREPFRRNPALMGWSRLEDFQPGGYLLEGSLWEGFLDEGKHLSLFQADVRL